MNNKKSRSFYISLSIIFCIAYIILAVKPLGSEYQFVPEWKIDVTNPTISADQDFSRDDVLSFKLGQRMGYFNSEGKVLNFVTFPQKASISDCYYTFYANNNSKTAFYTPDGKSAGTLNFSGFPMVDEDRIFIFLPGGTSFDMCTSEGKLKWEYSGTTPLTAFDSSENRISAGFADGNICVFDFDGNLLQKFAPGGSDLPVISGVAVSNNGNYVASVCGQNKQRFVLAKTDDIQTKIIYHEFLNSTKTRQNLVKFCNDDTTVFFNCDDVLGIVDVKSGKNSHIKISGQAISMKESGNCIYILTKEGRRYTVYTVEKFATLIGSFCFEADNAFIQTKNNKLYVGKDASISCINLEKK